MAIEKVTMMNVIGSNEYTDNFIRDIFLYGDIQMASAMEEIESGRFTLPVSKSNIKEMIGFSYLQSGEEVAEDNQWEKKRQRLLQLYNDSLQFDVPKLDKVHWTKEETKEHLSVFDSFIDDVIVRSQSEKEKLADLEKSIETYSYLSDIDIEMSELDRMTYFTYSLGSVPKQNAERLKRIYNTVTSVIFHVDDMEHEEVFLVITPKELEVETNRILRSVGFKPMTGLNSSYEGKPSDIVSKLKREKQQCLANIEKMQSEQTEFCQKHLEDAKDLFNHLELFANIDDIKHQLAFSDSNFYFSCWISVHEKEKLQKLKKKYPSIIIQFGEEDSGSKPPTKLKNNWFFRPFENLVKMYGIPSHDELDPTPFLSITYLFCFGYMFGDVGQGLVLLLGGYIAGKKGIALGHTLTRMAISSIIFGFIYGSVFGNEKLLPALWIRPFENINTILITAVVCGVIMLFVAYVYSIINKMKTGNIKEGIFGPNGIAGFVLYLDILIIALSVAGFLTAVQAFVIPLSVLAVVLIALVLFREPIANTIQRRKLYDSSAGDYYVEAGFGLFEMLLSMLSNTLSFIRVGAFALTHVGLFLAFETLAKMIGGGVGGIVVLILGNVLIIVLEGLIDFIQCLRLQFYELFSKYYTGDGEEFVPVRSSK